MNHKNIMAQFIRHLVKSLQDKLRYLLQRYFIPDYSRYHNEQDNFCPGRLLLVMVGFGVIFSCYILILITMTIRSSNNYKGLHQLIMSIGPVTAIHQRVNIVDRHQRVLATDLKTMSLYAKLYLVENPEILAAKICSIFKDLDLERLTKRLAISRYGEILIRKNISPQEQQRLLKLNSAALFFQEDIKRIYPQEPLASHILGYTDIDNNGIAGLELQYDDYLKDIRNPPLRLTLDARIQNVMRRTLQSALKTHQATGAIAILMHIQSGEILGAVSLPDFDANHRNRFRRRDFFYGVTQGVYEIGSVFKIFTLANGYESGAVKFGQTYDVSKGIYQVDDYEIRDEYIRSKILTAEEIFAYSSNLGTIQMILAIGKDRQRSFLRSLGLMQHLENVEFPSLGMPLYPKIWRDSNMITISYGYGLATTPLHVIRGVAAIVNDGYLVEPKFVFTPRPTSQDLELAAMATTDPPNHSTNTPAMQVVSNVTSQKMLRAMRLVVLKGTGKRAEIKGIGIAGKTGTARKFNPKGGYSMESYMASFIGVFPAKRPQYVALVIMDSPKVTDPKLIPYGLTPGGGLIAAPIFHDMVNATLPFLDIIPYYD